MNNLALVWENYEIRTMFVENEPWWVLADVCRALSLTNPRRVAERLDEDEKLTVPNSYGQTGNGGAQFFNLVNEPGLYRVILTSRSPKAKSFRRWVTHDVLPSIRKTGYYSSMTDQELYEQLGKRLNGQQELVLREYVPVEPRSSVVSAIPLSWVTEKTVTKRRQ